MRDTNMTQKLQGMRKNSPPAPPGNFEGGTRIPTTTKEARVSFDGVYGRRNTGKRVPHRPISHQSTGSILTAVRLMTPAALQFSTIGAARRVTLGAPVPPPAVSAAARFCSAFFHKAGHVKRV